MNHKLTNEYEKKQIVSQYNCSWRSTCRGTRPHFQIKCTFLLLWTHPGDASFVSFFCPLSPPSRPSSLYLTFPPFPRIPLFIKTYSFLTFILFALFYLSSFLDSLFHPSHTPPSLPSFFHPPVFLLPFYLFFQCSLTPSLFFQSFPPPLSSLSLLPSLPFLSPR